MVAAPGAPKPPDWRLPGSRREAWQRNYTFTLRYAVHPGCVYFALPYMADQLGWDAEQRYWAAWLNANTQNPATMLLLMEQASRPAGHERASAWQQRNWHILAWDTDRKYQKAKFPQACARYAEMMDSAGGQASYWAGTGTWEQAWTKMTALPYMGRLSAWSGLEYVRLLGDTEIPDADTLLLGDAAGSRSHRNGLALLSGHDTMLHDAQLNPAGADPWAPDFRREMEALGESLLSEARQRNPGHRDVGYLTLESALCTWKSWHKRNRRYPGVYADMMHDRIRWAEARHGDRFGVLWDARKHALPAWLRLEDTPTDPGVSPVKQNHYRETGQQVLLGHDWPDMWSSFDQAVADGTMGVFR